MEKARYNTELYSNLRGPLNNVKPSNFWGSHQFGSPSFLTSDYTELNLQVINYSRTQRTEMPNALQHCDAVSGISLLMVFKQA